MYTDNGSYSIYFPSNTSGLTDAIVYFPGADGAGNDGSAMREYIQTNPDKVVIINSSCGAGNIDEIYGALDDVQQNTNIKIDNVNFLGHSAGQSSAVDVAAEAKNYGYNANYVVSLDSADYAVEFNNKGEQAQKLAQNGTKMLMFDQRLAMSDEKRGNQDNLKKFTESGVPLLYVYCTDSNGDFWDNHSAINEETVRDGIIDFICGDTDKIKDSSSFTYNYITYDSEKGKWVTLSKEQAEKMITEGKVALASPKNEKVLSDREYANKEMNAIKSSIINSYLSSPKNISLPNGSTTSSPQINIKTYNKLYNGIDLLKDKITNELTMGIKIAEVYEQLDEDLKKRIANEILNSNLALKSQFAKECLTPLIDNLDNQDGTVYNTDTLEGRFLYIYNKLTKEYGYSKTGAKAILANMIAENNTLEANRYQLDDPTQSGYGLCQWEFSKYGGSGRADEMVDYCTKLGIDYTTIDGQVAWLDHELQTKFVNYGDNLYNDLKTATADDYMSLTQRFCTFYEAPAYNNGEYRALNSKATELFGLIDSGVTVSNTQQQTNQYLNNQNQKNTQASYQNMMQPNQMGSGPIANENYVNSNYENTIPSIASHLGAVGTQAVVSNVIPSNNKTRTNNVLPSNNEIPTNNVEPNMIVPNSDVSTQNIEPNPVSSNYNIPTNTVEYDTSTQTNNVSTSPTESDLEIPTNEIPTQEIEPDITINNDDMPIDNIETTPNEINNNTTTSTQNSGIGKKILTAAGITAAVGAAAGAAYYGVNQTKKNNEIEEPDEELEEEINDNQDINY